jgi:hypothetical protein
MALPSACARSARTHGLAMSPVLRCFAVGFTLRYAAGAALDAVPFITLFPAILVAALIGGLRVGLVVAVLSFFSGWYFFLPPRGTVKDLSVARLWYQKLFQRTPDFTPMPTLAEWRFPGGGSLQVYVGPERAGGGSCTLTITDIEKTLGDLKQLGIDPGKVIDGGKAKVVMVKDPDGNSIAFAQAMEAGLRDKGLTTSEDIKLRAVFSSRPSQ